MPASDPIQCVTPTSEDALPRTDSQHIGESNQDASFGGQTQSETTLDIPTPVLSREPPSEPQEPVSHTNRLYKWQFLMTCI
jgi:hypothetical protein